MAAFSSQAVGLHGKVYEGTEMTDQDRDLQALREEMSKLQLHVKELSEENRDLRDICDENQIPYKESLAVRRHRRSFATALAERPLGQAATGSDLQGAEPIVRLIVECAGSVLRRGERFD